jgi:hypothetical protein
LTLLAGWWALGGPRWRLGVWAASILLLSFSRDAGLVAVAAAAWVAVAERGKRSVALAGTGLVAALPAPLLFGAPFRQTMAFTFGGNRIPEDDSWHFVGSQYVRHVKWMIRDEFPVQSHLLVTGCLLALIAIAVARPSSPVAAQVRRATLAAGLLAVVVLGVFVAPLQLEAFPDPLPTGIILLLGVAALFIGRGDTLAHLLRGGAVGAIGMICLLPEYTAGRLSLVLLPFATMGSARLWTRARAADLDPDRRQQIRELPDVALARA